MKKYYKPKMNVFAFDSDDKIVTSGIKEWEEAYEANSQTIAFKDMAVISNTAYMEE